MTLRDRFIPIKNKKEFDIISLILSTHNINGSTFSLLRREEHFPLVVYWFSGNKFSTYDNFRDTNFDIFISNNLKLLSVEEIMSM